MSFIYSILFKFVTIENVSMVIAKAIAFILKYASKKNGKAWDKSKAIITRVNNWTSLFMQVYDDDTLTTEEEAIIAEAIQDQTNIKKLVNILKKAEK